MTATIVPKITQAGVIAANDAINNNTQLGISHIGWGTGTYDPDGTETAMVAESARRPIATGDVVQNQVRFSAIWDDDAANTEITEIGIYAGATLFAVWSTSAGTLAGHKTELVDFISFYDFIVAGIPEDSITIIADNNQSALLAALAAHTDDPNAHGGGGSGGGSANNMVINGDFSVHRKTGTTASIKADGWNVTSVSFFSGASSVLRIPETYDLVSGEGSRMLRLSDTANGNTNGTYDFEGKTSISIVALSGRNVTISFFARANILGLQVTPSLFIDYGDGGSADISIPFSVQNISDAGEGGYYEATAVIPDLRTGKTFGLGDESKIRFSAKNTLGLIYDLDITNVKCEFGESRTTYVHDEFNIQTIKAKGIENFINYREITLSSSGDINGGIDGNTYAELNHALVNIPDGSTVRIQVAAGGGTTWSKTAGFFPWLTDVNLIFRMSPSSVLESVVDPEAEGFIARLTGCKISFDGSGYTNAIQKPKWVLKTYNDGSNSLVTYGMFGIEQNLSLNMERITLALELHPSYPNLPANVAIFEPWENSGIATGSGSCLMFLSNVNSTSYAPISGADDGVMLLVSSGSINENALLIDNYKQENIIAKSILCSNDPNNRLRIPRQGVFFRSITDTTAPLYQAGTQIVFGGIRQFIGLNAIPEYFTVILQCVVADNGYPVGSRLYFAGGDSQNAGSDDSGIQTSFNLDNGTGTFSTAVVRFGTNGVKVIPSGGGDAVNLTSGRWRVSVALGVN